MRGDEAYTLGLVDRLAPAEGLRAVAHEFAAEIAGTAPLTLRSIRETLRGDFVDRVRAIIVREKEQQALQRNTADHAEGIDADLNRRKPVFQAR